MGDMGARLVEMERTDSKSSSGRIVGFLPWIAGDSRVAMVASGWQVAVMVEMVVAAVIACVIMIMEVVVATVVQAEPAAGQ